MMPMDWARFEHAYGSAADIPGLFDQVGDAELADDAWCELWESLCHQGSVYTASFAALPILADIAAGRRAGDREGAVVMAGCIVAGEAQLHRPEYVRERYPDAIRDLLRAAEQHLSEGSFDAGEMDCLDAMEAMLAFEGVPVWGEYLRIGLYDVRCPRCSADLEVEISGDESGTRYRDPHEDLRRLNFNGPPLTAVSPATPGELGPLAARLHRLAVGAGQPAAAQYVMQLFGRTTCPGCGADFSVPEQTEAFRP